MARFRLRFRFRFRFTKWNLFKEII
jgi:hypothetical protein